MSSITSWSSVILSDSIVAPVILYLSLKISPSYMFSYLMTASTGPLHQSLFPFSVPFFGLISISGIVCQALIF